MEKSCNKNAASELWGYHSYPFGLTMAGISSKATGGVESKQKFQGQELAQNEFSDGSGLVMYEFKWRMGDPQIGRFWQIDPLADKYVYNSTYAFSENKVTNHVELEGLESVEAAKAQAWREVKSEFQGAANWLDRTFSIGSKTKVEKTTGSGTVVVERTTETKTNVGPAMSYIICNNTNEGYKGPIVKTETKSEVSTQRIEEVKTPVVTVRNTISTNQDGKTTSTAEVTGKARGGFEVGVNGSQNSNGDKKIGGNLSVSSTDGNTTFKTSLTGSSSGTSSQKYLELNISAQQKIDNTRVSHTYFIRVKGN